MDDAPGTMDAAEAAPKRPEHAPGNERPIVPECPVCHSRRLHYAFSIGGERTQQAHRVVRCDECRLMLQSPQPSDAELADIYGARYFIGQGEQGPGRPDAAHVAQMKAATARGYVRLLDRYRGEQRGALLDVGCGHGDLLIEARWVGYQVSGVELSPVAAERARRRLREEAPPCTGGGVDGSIICGRLEDVALAPASFDVVVLADVIEHARDPGALLRAVHRVLRPDGTLLVATPSLESWSARLLRRKWMEFKPEHLTYFDPATLQSLLFQNGFHQTIVRPGWKVLSLDYVAGHFHHFPVPVLSRLVRTVTRIAPRGVRQADVPIVASGLVALTRAKVPSPLYAGERVRVRGDGASTQRTCHPSAPLTPALSPEYGGEGVRTLSIVVPAYNEATTVGPLLDAVLRKDVPGMAIEVIVVESNSTDGTREVVRRYADHPRVRLVLEDRPRGKGHAVRTGLAQARGDFILIQDADLEYDLEDYDVLLEPLASGREAFVLGARHGGGAWWKMRQFNQQPLMSLFFNCGHWFFTALLNVLFGQRLKDPFTMFKVFRRDCLYGLEFRCNRFDFDHELLVKLVRKGYRPVEIPVNYRSRSFDEGKKVSALRDPLSWVLALTRLRFTRIDPLAVIERRRIAAEDPETPTATRIAEAA